MNPYIAENIAKHEQAERARQDWLDKARKALAAARDCRVKDETPIDPEIKAKARELGSEAAIERKAYLAVAAASASARRVACGIALRKEQERIAKPEPTPKPLKPPPRSEE